MEDIERLYNDFRTRVFPRGDLGKIDIADLAEVSGFSVGCISTFIYRKGTLDEHRKATLQRCIQTLEVMEGAVNDDNLKLKSYITALLDLSKKVLALS